jgi:hypothetical protein
MTSTTAPVRPLVFGEPIGARAELVALARTAPAEARRRAPDRLAGVAWAAWRDRLEEVGISLEAVRAGFSGAEWEIWLWVNGDRSWEQLAPLLAGRVARRALPGG